MSISLSAFRSPIPWAVVVIAALLGCETTKVDADRKTYAELADTMEAEIEPLVEVLLVKELAKDPESIDFARIGNAATRAAGYFRNAATADHSMFLRKTKDQASARQAAAWFTVLAGAAERRSVAELARAYTRKQKICSACHEY